MKEFSRSELGITEEGQKYHIIRYEQKPRVPISYCGEVLPFAVEVEIIGVRKHCKDLCKTCLKAYKTRKACKRKAK